MTLAPDRQQAILFLERGSRAISRDAQRLGFIDHRAHRLAMSGHLPDVPSCCSPVRVTHFLQLSLVLSQENAHLSADSVNPRAGFDQLVEARGVSIERHN